jgi:hypothetical protein
LLATAGGRTQWRVMNKITRMIRYEAKKNNYFCAPDGTVRHDGKNTAK